MAQRLQLRVFCERSLCCLSHPDASVRQQVGWTSEAELVSPLSTGSILTRPYPPLCQAFLGVCDVLTAHSYQLQVWDPASFGPLLYTPSPKLQRALLTFVCAHVFVGADGYSQCSGETYVRILLLRLRSPEFKSHRTVLIYRHTRIYVLIIHPWYRVNKGTRAKECCNLK